MSVFKKLLMLLGAVSIGTASVTPPLAQETEVTISPSLTDEEACRRALEENTIEALEDYLLRFPNGACRVLALNALSQFAPEGDGQPSPNPGGGYGG